MTTQITIPQSLKLYDQDFYLWLKTTAQLLKEKQFNQIDLENLIEEIETMGRSEKKSLKSNLIVLLLHLLKWQYQPNKRSGSWKASIIEHRRRLNDDLEDSPSLNSYLSEILVKCYQEARKQASAETDLSLSHFPTILPFTIEQILDQNYLTPQD
jgi:hypothetical protein